MGYKDKPRLAADGTPEIGGIASFSFALGRAAFSMTL